MKFTQMFEALRTVSLAFFSGLAGSLYRKKADADDSEAEQAEHMLEMQSLREELEKLERA